MIRLNMAKKYTTNNPRTNVPMSCIFCNQWEWKCSMRGHADESHARATKMRKAETDGQQLF